MAVKKLVLSDVFKKDLRLLGFLVVSGVLGYVLAKYVANDPTLTMVFGPAINYVLYRLEQEKKNEGYLEVLRK